MRAWNLGGNSLWYDEGYSAQLASESLIDMLGHTSRDIHPPLYYALLHVWTAVAGASDFSLAFPSLAFGLLLAAGVAALARTWFGTRSGSAALFLAALSPAQAWYSHEVRMYTLAACCVLGAVAAVGSGMRSPRSRALYVLATGAGLWTLYYTAFALAGLWLVVLTAAAARRPLVSVRVWALANAGVALLWAPWIPTAFRHATSPGVPPWRESAPGPLALWEGWSSTVLGQGADPGSSLPALVAAVGLVFLGLGNRKALLAGAVAGLAVGGILLAGLVTPLFHVRYVFPFSGLVLVMISAAFAVRWRGAQVATAVMLVVAISPWPALNAAFHNDSRLQPDDYRSAARALDSLWRPGDAVLTTAGYTYAPLLHYWLPSGLWRGRLGQRPPDSVAPALYEAPAVDGPDSLGNGDPTSDFFAMPAPAVEAGLREIAGRHGRIWVLRAYDTVTDPDGRIRSWLAANGTLVSDTQFGGASSIRLQGYAFSVQGIPQIAATDGLQLAGRLDRALADEGGLIGLTVAVSASAERVAGLRLVAYLLDAHRRIVAQADTPIADPDLRASTAGLAVRPGLRVPVGQAPGQYEVHLSAYAAGGPPFALRLPGGAISPRAPLGQVTVRSVADLPEAMAALPISHDLGQGLRLVGRSAFPEAVIAGEIVDLELLVRAERGTTERLLAVVSGPEGGARSESRATVGGLERGMQRWVSFPLRVPSSSAAGEQRVRVEGAGASVELGTLAVRARPAEPPPRPLAKTAEGQFGGVVRVAAYDLLPGTEAFNLVTRWRVVRPADARLTLFAQALSVDSVRWQADIAPQPSALTWVPSLEFEIAAAMPRAIADALARGEMRVYVGWYDPLSGARLRLEGGADWLELRP